MVNVKEESGKICIDGENPNRCLGQYYKRKDRIYILAGNRYNGVVLVCLNDGSYWTDPDFVDDESNISDTEWENITSGYNFVRVV